MFIPRSFSGKSPWIVRFIKEIQNRIAIWDTTDESYYNRISKLRQWEELAEYFLSREMKFQGKKWCVARLQRKWKSLRSGFMKEVSRIEKLKNGQPWDGKSQYMYYENLSFLHKVAKNKNPPTTDFLGDTRAPGVWGDTKQTLLPWARPEQKVDDRPELVETKVKIINNDATNNTDIVEVLSDCERQTEPEKSFEPNGPFEPLVSIHEADVKPKIENNRESDWNFLKSLLEPMRSIPAHKRFMVRIKIMKLIERERTNDYPPICSDSGSDI